MAARPGIREWFDNAEAVFFALLVHVLIAAMLVIGISWRFEQTPTAGTVIQAQVVDVSELVASMERQRQRAAETEQARQEAAEQARREQARREAEQRAREQAAQERREQEAAEQRRQEQAEQARLEQQRQEQLEAIRRQQREAAEAAAAAQQRLEELREQRAGEQAERERQAEIQRQQAAAARAAAAEREAQLASRQGAWISAVQAVVTQSWIRPPTARPGLVCTVQVYAIPGGEVVNAHVISPCNADEATKRSIINAVMSASPLPYQGFEEVFQRSFNFEFRYDG